MTAKKYGADVLEFKHILSSDQVLTLSLRKRSAFSNCKRFDLRILVKLEDSNVLKEI